MCLNYNWKELQEVLHGILGIIPERDHTTQILTDVLIISNQPIPP